MKSIIVKNTVIDTLDTGAVPVDLPIESSPIPGEDKLLLWNQAAFERRKDSDQKKELLKEDLVVEMSVFAGKKAVGDPPCDWERTILS